MSYRYRSSMTYTESALMDALDKITEMESSNLELEERAADAERLFKDCFWCLKKIDDEVADKFRDENPEMEKYI